MCLSCGWSKPHWCEPFSSPEALGAAAGVGSTVSKGSWRSLPTPVKYTWSRLPPEWLWGDQWCYRTNCFLRYTCRQLQVCCELWNSLQLLTIWRDHFKEAWGKVSSTHCLLVFKGMWFVDLKSSEIIEKRPKIHQINALRIYVSETFPAWGLCSTEGLRKSQKRKMHLITGTLSEV